MEFSTMTNQNQSPSQLDARVQLRDLFAGAYVSRAIYVAAQLDIATVLADGHRTYAELARITHTRADTLYRLLRALASHGLFAENDHGCFANTEKSALLRSDITGSMRPLILMFGDELIVTLWQSLSHSVTTGEPAFEHVYGMHQFDYLSLHPDKAKIFDDAMVSVSSMTNPVIAKAYDFSSFATIVDIAGGYGSTLCTILAANPRTRGVLFDMPHVMEGARQYVAGEGLTDRCTCVPGDFFEAVPAGADAYFMKHIIHDWDDARCIQLLRNCHAAAPAKAKLLVCERVVPPGNTPSYSKLSDLVMLMMTPGGRERTHEQYRTLFEAGGFTITRFVPTESEHTVIEAIPI
jgi:O-methyltransferase domain/Dimerisation domain